MIGPLEVFDNMELSVLNKAFMALSPYFSLYNEPLWSFKMLTQ